MTSMEKRPRIEKKYCPIASDTLCHNGHHDSGPVCGLYNTFMEMCSLNVIADVLNRDGIAIREEVEDEA